MNLSQSLNVIYPTSTLTHARARTVPCTVRQNHRTRCDGCRSFVRHFPFYFVEHDVVVLASSQNAKMLLRAKHETLLTSTAVRINYTRRPIQHSRATATATASNLNFLEFGFSYSEFSSLSFPFSMAGITQLSDLHETPDPSIRFKFPWARDSRIN